MPPLNLRAMGFCGVDDSISPKMLNILSCHYPWIEWGVLFRPDKEGSPRYASSEWVERLTSLNKGGQDRHAPMKLAGHLCGSRCQDVISGNSDFVDSIHRMGFGRVQINATAANNVQIDPSKYSEYIENVRKCISDVPGVEWIIQCNTETKWLWEALISDPPPNMSVLFDSSCGLGVPMTEFPKPLSNVLCGYAGGIGPAVISGMLERITEASNGTSVWVDMESSLRSKVIVDGEEVDKFSVDKCLSCCLVGVNEFGLTEHNL